MNTILRTSLLGLAALLGGVTFAQSYFVTVRGHVTPCDPAIAGGQVRVRAIQGTTPAHDTLVPLNPNCFYSVMLPVDNATGWFQTSVSCADSSVASNYDQYRANALNDTTALMLDLSCGSCQTLRTQINTMGGGSPFLATFSGISTGGMPPYSYGWRMPDGSTNLVTAGPHQFLFSGPGTYAACLTVTDANGCTSTACDTVRVGSDGTINPPNPASCQACFTTAQASGGGALTPFVARFTDCSSGGTPPYSHNWLMPDNSTSTQPNPTFQFSTAGTYTVCLTITDANGCTNSTCDSVRVDGNGTINPPVAPAPCRADFWVMQGYTTDSTGNPNGGGVEPIPFELWIWNLSSGGNGSYQFLWDFGDGTTSTDPYPTHVYGSSGPYLLCLTMYDGSFIPCTDTHCDTVVVDNDGLLGMSANPDARSALTVRVISQLPTGIGERRALEAGNAWPNPVTDALYLALNSSRGGNLEIAVLDLNGRLLRTANHAVAAGRNTLTIPVEELDAGMYLLRIGIDGQALTRRFVKGR